MLCSLTCLDVIKYILPDVSMVAMADVTIYGMECNFCEEDFETLDHLVRHLVNEHDELWDYEKTYENALKRIKIDENLLKELGQFRNFSISEG